MNHSIFYYFSEYQYINQKVFTSLFLFGNKDAQQYSTNLLINSGNL